MVSDVLIKYIVEVEWRARSSGVCALNIEFGVNVVGG